MLNAETIKMLNVTAIEPCPFCGAQDLLIEAVNGSRLGPDYYILCASCGGQGPFSDDYSKSLDGWNTRAALQPKEG
jgi:Lar family restriction alleviation protein